MKTFKQYIKESPDEITIDFDSGEFLSFDDEDAYTFIIIGDTTLYGKTIDNQENVSEDGIRSVTSRNIFHVHIMDFFKKALRGETPPPTLEELDRRGIKSINYDPVEFFKDKPKWGPYFNYFMLDRQEAATKMPSGYTILSGRYWADIKAISFWDPMETVVNNIRKLVPFLSEMGQKPSTIKWEIYDGDEGIERLVSYKELTGMDDIGDSTESEMEFKKKKLADHLQAGMKGYMDNKPSMKQINPNMPNVQYRDLTTFGDSYNRLVNQILYESPDEILIKNGQRTKKLDFKSSGSAPFIIIDNRMIIYNNTGSLRVHPLLLDTVIKVFNEEGKITEKDLQDRGVFSFNFDEVLINDPELISSLENYSIYRQESRKYKSNFIAGRMWGHNNGIISFWESKSKVLKSIDIILDFVKTMGFVPEKMLWEQFEKSSLKFKLVPFNKFLNSKNLKSTKEEERAIQAKLALHMQAGMKKLIGQTPKGKQYTPNMTNAEYKHLTTQSESIDATKTI